MSVCATFGTPRSSPTPTVARFKDSASARTTGTGPFVWCVKFSGFQCLPPSSFTSTGSSCTTVAAW